MNRWRRSRADLIFDTANTTFFVLVLAVVLYPLYFIVIASVSDPLSVSNGKVWFWPDGFYLEGYKKIFAYDAIWAGYRNSFLYAIVGTTVNVGITITGGYALSRQDMAGRSGMMFLIVVTMFFSGGIIPLYLLVKELSLLNTLWAVIIPTAVNAYYLIIVRSFFQSNIPKELLEAAQMDGSNDFSFFGRIVIPLSKPIIAVICLFYAVIHWNSYFNAMIFFTEEVKYPLQLVLRKILIMNDTSGVMSDPGAFDEQMRFAELIKFGVIIVASIPVLVLYPFLQKYFVKGVMIGSIKG